MWFIIIIAAFGMLAEVYARFDHHGWQKGSIPNKEATISRENIEGSILAFMIGSGKNIYGSQVTGKKVTYLFSDGFYYTSYKYKEVRGSANNRVQIRQKAMDAHQKAVDKRIRE